MRVLLKPMSWDLVHTAQNKTKKVGEDIERIRAERQRQEIIFRFVHPADNLYLVFHNLYTRMIMARIQPEGSSNNIK